MSEEALYARRPEVYDALYADKPYDEEVEWVLDRFASERESVPETPTALVVGCGTGEHSRRLVEAGMAVTGVDRYEAMVERARGKSGATFRVDRLPDLSVEGTYDLVWAPFTVLNHVPPGDLGESVRAMVDRLAPDGVLVVDLLRIVAGDDTPGLSTYATEEGEYARLTQVRPAEGVRHQYDSLVVTPDGDVFVDTHDYYDHDVAFVEGVLAGAGLSASVGDWYGFEEEYEDGVTFVGTR